MLEFHGGLNDGVDFFFWGLKMEILGFSWDFIGIHGDWSLYQLTVLWKIFILDFFMARESIELNGLRVFRLSSVRNYRRGFCQMPLLPSILVC